MVTKATLSLPFFGKYLSEIRQKAGIKSQRLAANIMLRDLSAGGIRFSDLKTISDNQVRADEKGLISDIPPERLKAYSVLYGVPYEEIVARLAEEKYKVQFSTGVLWEEPDWEAYKILRFLLDTKKYKKVLAGLQLLADGIEAKIQKAAAPEEDRIWEMVSEREEAQERKN